MASFLFARALNMTEEFLLASNMDGAGAFDDLVFRYRLREPDVWKTCFIQLKHKKNEDTINLSGLTKMSGYFSLFKYFESYCKIKKEYSTDSNLKHLGPFADFEFIIYTNVRIENNSPLQGGNNDPVSILSSGPNYGEYITFDETCDRHIFQFFKELSQYHNFICELDSLFKRGTFGDQEITEKIKSFQCSVTSKAILWNLNKLKSTPNKECLRRLLEEVAKCDFTLSKEFLHKVKIFQCQSNEGSLKDLIEKELMTACKASLSVANSIYTKFEEGLSKWWEEVVDIEKLSKNSKPWKNVEEDLISKINEISKLELQTFVGCGMRFSQQHIQSLCDTIQQNTFLNIVTNSNIRILQKLKAYQSLNILGYRNAIFIGLKSLVTRRKEICKLWPCKWSAVLVIDCDCDGDVADILLDILQQTVDCEQCSDISDDNKIETLVDALKKYEQKVILISTRQHKNLVSRLQKKFENICADYEDNFGYSVLDEESQKKILERTVDFQGKKVTLETLVGTDPPEIIKHHMDADVISVLLSGEGKFCVGRKLGDTPKYYVQRSLEHRVYLKDDVMLKDNAVTLAVSGLQVDQLKKYLPAGEKISEFVYDERRSSHSFTIYSDFSKPGYSAELKNMKSRHKTEEATKPEDVRYVILGDVKPESDFRKLKELCTNVHWIHMENGSFLWRDSNCNIDIIRRHIDNTKCKKYDIQGVMEERHKAMSLVAEPGMGKSTFLSHMEHEIKKQNPSMWVLRVNLNEHTRALENIDFEQDCIDKCKIFLWNTAHSPEQDALHFVQKIFIQASDQTGKMVIILDGFDEISPDYSPKVETLIRAIREETSSKILVSSRFSHRQDLEDLTIQLAFTLQPFTRENRIQCLEQYWNGVPEISNQGNLRKFAEKLLSLSSKNFSDKDGEFTGIPLQTIMLGEAFVKEAKDYCSSGKFNLPEKFNLLSLFKQFIERKWDIYCSEKNAMDSSKPEVKREKKSCLEKHMTSALLSLFSVNEVKENLGAINSSDLKQARNFMRSISAQRIGIITNITDGKPHFIHRCFAEYFAAKWFADNFKKCGDFICNTLFNSTYEVTRNIFDRMLAEDSEIHGAVLSNEISTVEEMLKKKTGLNLSDKGGRTALHLAASYNRPFIQDLLSFRGVDVNKLDEVLKWTPLKYAYRTKSWMALDILLQNGANPDDMVLTRRNFEVQEWGQTALWECASKGHRKLLEFILNCGTDVNAVIEVPENILGKNTLLHIASFCGQLEVVRLLLEWRADTNIRNANNDTALHCAAHLGSADIIKLLLDKGISVNVTNTQQNTPLHIAAARSNLEATIALVKKGAALNRANVSGHTPLMLAAYSGKLEVVRYLTETGPKINIHAALLVAVERGHFDVIDLLLAKGADIDGSYEAGDISPLILATLRQNLPIVKHLVQKGADVNPSTADGNSKLALCAAASVGNLEITEYLLKEDADLNARDIKGMTALAVAVFYNNTELALYLMDRGADVNVPDVEKRTPLHDAVWNNNPKCTKHLVQAGANINYQGPGSVTALSLAVELGRTHIINVLVENHASTNLRDDLGHTALHVAVGKGNLWLVHYLIERGADVNIPNKEGNTPLQWIRERKWIMADYLLYTRMPKCLPLVNMKRVVEMVVTQENISFEPRVLSS